MPQMLLSDMHILKIPGGGGPDPDPSRSAPG